MCDFKNLDKNQIEADYGWIIEDQQDHNVLVKSLKMEANYWEKESNEQEVCREYNEGIAWGIRHALEVLENKVPF